MREGLRSAAKLCKKIETAVKKDQHCNGDKDCDSGTREETFTFTSNQDVDFGQKDGFRNEGLNLVSAREDGSDLVVEVVSKDDSKCKESPVKITSAEVSSNASKRRRIDAEIDSTELVWKGECDMGRKFESKEFVSDKIQAVGRVLRSAMKTKSENEGNVGRNKGFVSEKQPKGCGRADNESIEAKTEVESQSKGEFGDPFTSKIKETQKAAVEKDQQCNGETVCDSGTKDAFFSTSTQDVGADLNDGPINDDFNYDSGTEEDGSRLVVEVGPKYGSKCEESGGISGTAKVNAVEVITSARKRRIDGERESKLLAQKTDFDIGKKIANEKVLDDKPQAVGRVLRSRSAMNTKCKNEDKLEQSKEVVSEIQPRGFEGSENENVEAKKEVQSHFNGELSDPSTTEIGEKPKRKRGRPPKSLEGNESEKKIVEVRNNYVSKKSSCRTKFKRKRGRPRKVENFDGMELDKEKSCQFDVKESDKSYGPPKKKLKKKKRGRPRLERDDRKVGLRENIEKGTKSMHNVRISPVSRKRSAQEESKTGHLISVKKTKFGDIENGGNIFEQTAAGSTLQDKQAVRDKIVKLLLGAGWTVQYRPRNGRDYCDSVYVNPEGRTHWSVTLAYRVFMKDSDMRGATFTPIPDEELSILTRIVSKQRSDKNKKKKKKNLKHKDGYVDNDEEFAKIKRYRRKLQKRKLRKSKPGTAGSLSHKMLNGRMKAKASRNEHSNSTRDHKRVKVHAKRGFALMARDSKDGDESKNGGYVLYNGKRTVLAWMINLGTVLPNAKVLHFKRRKARILNGRITTDGIQCECCNETFTISGFESHAGTKTCQPLKNIHLESGISLLQCQLDSWHKQDEHIQRGFHLVNVDGEDPNDDTCGICGDGGSLICCDSCPSTFHLSCLAIENFPSGVWNCMYCLCKLCGKVDGNVCQEDKDSAALPPLVTCVLCEEKYHQSCVQVEDNISDDSSSVSLFCGRSCQELFEKLQTLLGVKHELEGGFSWSLVCRFDVSPDISVNGMARKVECNSKVAVALDVMDECFLPMIDHRSGVNLIHNVVYNFGSNFNRLNYTGFLTAILERGDEITAVASIRIHGKLLAEMPFIGTRHMYRRQGMCRRLLAGIETALRSLEVEKLIIPAISELRETWTSVFGFAPLEDSIKQKARNLNLMVFPGVDMLQKPMVGHNEEKLISESFTSKLEECQNVDNLPNDSGERCSAGFDLKTSSETVSSPVKKADGDPTELESVPVLSDCCLNDASDITTENVTQAGKMNVEVAAVESVSQVPDDCLRNNNGTSCNVTDASLTCGSGAVESTSLPIDDSSAVTYLDSKHEQFRNQSGTGIALIDINVPTTVDDYFDVVAADHEINPSRNFDVVTSNTTVNSTPQAPESNGHHIFETISPISCGIDLNVDNCQVTDTPRRITRASKLLRSDDNDVDINDASHGDSDTLCNSGGIGIHCASGGGNGCATTEVVVLSNKAS